MDKLLQSLKDKKALPLWMYLNPENRELPLVDQSDMAEVAKEVIKQPLKELNQSLIRLDRIANRNGWELPEGIENRLVQDSGYMEYEGSLDDRADDVRTAFRDQKILQFANIEATFPDFVLVHQYGKAGTSVGEFAGDYAYGDYPWNFNEADLCWKYPYTYDEATDAVAFGSPIAVNLSTVIKALDTGSAEAIQQDAAAGSGSGAATGGPTGGSMQFSAPGSTASNSGNAGQTDPACSTENPVLQPGAIVTYGTRPVRHAKVESFSNGVVRAHVHTMKNGTLSPTGRYVTKSSKSFKPLSSSQSQSAEGKVNEDNANEEVLENLNQGLLQDLSSTITTILTQESFDDKTKVMIVSGTATAADVKNVKNQVYPMEVWQDNLPRLQQMLQQGRLLGEAEHPKDGRMSLDRTCLQFTELWQDANEIKFKAKVLPTEPHGKNLQILIQNGVPIDISSRGEGRTQLQSWNGESNVSVVQKGFTCKAFDAVVAGASPNSTITDYVLQDASISQSNSEETMTKEEIEAMLAKNQQDTIAAIQGLLQQSATPDSNAGKTPEEIAADAAKLVQTSSSDANSGKTQDQLQQSATLELNQGVLTETKAAMSELQTMLLEQSIASAKSSVVAKVGPTFAPAYLKHLEKLLAGGTVKTAAEFNKALEGVDSLFQDISGDIIATNPGIGNVNFHVKKTAAELAPKTGRQLIEKLIEGVPDTLPNGAPFALNQDANEEALIGGVPDYIQTPKRQLRKWLHNIAMLQDGGFNGPAALQGLLAMENGQIDQAHSILDQSIPNGATGVGTGGAPTSQIHIFDLIRRVFPQLIANEIASIQPMDRPEGKIFFKDTYRIEAGQSEVTPDGVTLQNRARIDLGSGNGPDPSYSNDPGEFQTASLLQLRMASISVTAQTKKLAAIWSQEEVQDLRAYHNLDAGSELLSDMSTEIAMEWNYTVLAEMLAGATAANLTYGVTPPTGYSQADWERYLGRFLTALSSAIFKQRNGGATHIIAGPDAWTALAATMTFAAVPEGANPSLYAGLMFTPFADSAMTGMKTYQTNLWGSTNRNRILMVRKGDSWSDTGYIWAPYATYISPVLTLSDAFTNKQGIMDRAAHRVVQGGTMSTLTIANQQGAGIPFPTAS